MSFKEVKPYKILLIDENLYLACSNDKYDFSLFRIAGIKNITEIKKGTFNHDSQIVNFISHIQTAFPKFSPNWSLDKRIRVELEIAKQKAFLFEKRNFSLRKI